MGISPMGSPSETNWVSTCTGTSLSSLVSGLLTGLSCPCLCVPSLSLEFDEEQPSSASGSDGWLLVSANVSATGFRWLLFFPIVNNWWKIQKQIFKVNFIGQCKTCFLLSIMQYYASFLHIAYSLHRFFLMTYAFNCASPINCWFKLLLYSDLCGVQLFFITFKPWAYDFRTPSKGPMQS